LEQIESKVRQFLRENFFVDDSEDLQEDMSFMQTHLIDSTGFVELIAFVEESFGIEVRDEEMLPENLDSIASLKRYVTRKLNGNSRARKACTRRTDAARTS